MNQPSQAVLEAREALRIETVINKPSAARAIDTLVQLGLTPMLPVAVHNFADPEVRRSWIDERNLRVFTL